MDVLAARQVLMLEGDEPITRDQLRRAYMRQLRKFPPERDPDGFRRLREALELIEREVAWHERRAQLEAEYAEPEEPVIAPAVEPMIAPVVEAPIALPVAFALPAPVSAIEPAPPAPDLPPPPDPNRALLTLVNATLVHLEAGEIDRALELVGEWRQHPLDDRRALSPLTAQRWALTRDLLKVAMGLPRSLLSAFAQTIAHDDLEPLHDAIVSYRATHAQKLADLRVYLGKRAANLHTLFNNASASDSDARWTARPNYLPDPPSRSANPRWLGGLAVGLISVLANFARTDCDHRASHGDPAPLTSTSYELPSTARPPSFAPMFDREVLDRMTARLAAAAHDDSLDTAERFAAEDLYRDLNAHLPCVRLRVSLDKLTDHGHRTDELATKSIVDFHALCPDSP